MFAYRVGFFKLRPLIPVLVICISILFVSIFMYFDITFAMSFLIISIISGEQLTLSEISNIFNRSLATSLELLRFNMFLNNLIPS